MNWKMFSHDEVARLTAVPQPPDDETPRSCPACRKPTIRHYYHDYKSSPSPVPSGTSWFWCPLCKKFASFVGPTLQDDYFYNDPLADQIESVPSSNLLDRLDAEWQRGVLPQVFTPKQRR